jgi:hypothetical protein
MRPNCDEFSVAALSSAMDITMNTAMIATGTKLSDSWRSNRSTLFFIKHAT